MFDAHLDWCPWREADVTREVAHVRESGEHIAGLHGKQVLHCLLAEGLFQDFNEVEQVDRNVVAKE